MNPFGDAPSFNLFEPLHNHTIRQLKYTARLRKIPHYGRMTKPELIQSIARSILNR